MNNIGIILNQDNNQSYLGKFYNRNRLEFPVIRKIYEQIETNKNVDNTEKNISNTTITTKSIEEEQLKTNSTEIKKEIVNKIDIETCNDLDIRDNDDIIVLDNNYVVSKINKTELNTENNELELFDNISQVNNYIDKSEKNELPNLQLEHKFNNRELIFLWLSSIVLIVSIEYNLYSLFKNY
jgi:hypothetical protein